MALPILSHAGASSPARRHLHAQKIVRWKTGVTKEGEWLVGDEFRRQAQE